MSIILEILLVILYTLILLWVIKKASFFQIEGISSKAISLVFLLKLGAGIVLALIYTYYYTDRLKADVFKYFDDGYVMFSALQSNPSDFFRMLFGIGNDTPYFCDRYYSVMNNWYREYETNVYNDNHTIIRFNAVLHIFSFGFFHVHTVFMSFLALCGQLALVKFFRAHSQIAPMVLLFAVCLSPSVLFWTSGVLKEGLLFLGMGFLVYATDRLFKRFSLLYLFVLLISVVLLSYIKFYVFAALVPLLIAFVWSEKTHQKYISLKYAFVLLLFCAGGLYFHKVFNTYNLLEIMAAKQHDFYHLALHEESGSQIAITPIEPRLMSLLQNAPKAFFNVFFLPHIFASQNLLSYISAAENAFFLLLTLIAVFSLRFRKEDLNLFLFCLLFTVIIYVMIGLITPVTGAIVRYKTPAIPFLLIAVFLITNRSAIKNKLLFLLLKISKRKKDE